MFIYMYLFIYLFTYLFTYIFIHLLIVTLLNNITIKISDWIEISVASKDYISNYNCPKLLEEELSLSACQTSTLAAKLNTTSSSCSDPFLLLQLFFCSFVFQDITLTQ